MHVLRHLGNGRKRTHKDQSRKRTVFTCGKERIILLDAADAAGLCHTLESLSGPAIAFRQPGHSPLRPDKGLRLCRRAGLDSALAAEVY